jgi:hypothetical protein
MVAAKYGKADPDLSSRVGRKGKTKEISDKAALKASKRLPTTGMVGGVANAAGNPSEKKGSSKR